MSSATRRYHAAPRRGPLAVLSAFLLVTAVLSAVVVAPRSASAASATTTTALNLRRGPGTNYAVILVMPAGASVETVGAAENGFVPVTYRGSRGYASQDYLSTGGSGTVVRERTGATGPARVTTALNLRAGPSTSDAVRTVIPNGGSVTLTGERANGFAGLTYQGISGWGYASFITTVSGDAAPTPGAEGPTSGPTGTAYTTTSLNLRSGPGTGYGVVTVMPSGASVTLTGRTQSGFASVSYGGTSGWASSTYLSQTAPAPRQPAPTTPTAPAAGGSIESIIYAAADRYGQPRADMLRVARCESNLNPNAVNASSGASGLFQFMPGTWASTPYANQSIFDAWASANAAGWMWSVGRRNEWTCQ